MKRTSRRPAGLWLVPVMVMVMECGAERKGDPLLPQAATPPSTSAAEQGNGSSSWGDGHRTEAVRVAADADVGFVAVVDDPRDIARGEGRLDEAMDLSHAATPGPAAASSCHAPVYLSCRAGEW